MLKARKKWLSILITLAMLVGLMVPFAGPAAAVGTVYTPMTVPTVEDDGTRELGSFQIEIDPMYSSENSEAMIELPADYEIYTATITAYVYDETTGKKLRKTWNIEDIAKSSTPPVALSEGGNEAAKLIISNITDRGFKLKLDGDGIDGVAGEKFRILIGFPSVKVPAGVSEDIKVSITHIRGQLVDGSVVVGKISEGALKVSVMDDESFSDEGGYVTLRVEETVPGTFAAGDKLKLELPDGFSWGGVVNVDFIFGTLEEKGKTAGASKVVSDPEDKFSIEPDSDEDTLEITLKSTGDSSTYYESTQRMAIEIKVRVEVTDSDEAESGDVVVKVKGDYDVSPTEIIVGQYGEYETEIEAKDPSIVAYAGQVDQEVSDIVIKESIKGSLVDGRTITLTLPENARWFKIDDQELAKDGSGKWTSTSKDFEVDSDNGVKLKFVGLQGTDDRTAKFKIERSSTEEDPAELTIEDISVALKAGVTGDLKVEVGGSAGLTGEITIAKVVNPVTVTAEKTNVQIGKADQAAGKIVIAEYAAGAIDTDDGNRSITLTLPEGVKFSSKPTVEVTKGDIEIETVDVKDADDGRDDAVLEIEFKDNSDEASTIEISDIYYDIDRTFGEGDIKVKIGGKALVYSSIDGYDSKEPSDDPFFEDPDYLVKVANATCVTPAPSEVKQTAVFTINSTTYTVNGVQATMDVAPYIKDGRTYLPVRYVAYALGISPENVIWDGVKATFIGQVRVVQVTPGSTILAINGAPVTMDVAAEVVNGRVMVPFRWVAQAFGAQVDWDEANQTVTMNL
ncbi:copper amine oxidase N-terminal domain-containing protein [Thermanaeromonas sp. C210]|uniref:copper amine oxidase N-terminal domain-containing protein n=1 Tax=Thermanaeromonas sp. C210 TaxID=2731925 RepID=UPI00155D0701|nr:copper amine oxidase N-terminal domain-containing protein [Thermanaeromonas sp. C210]GFN21827.1 copper amine oxidase-like protein [Thermanaeromonas sp. C210]